MFGNVVQSADGNLSDLEKRWKCKVSLIGVGSLWGDCMFILADWAETS